MSAYVKKLHVRRLIRLSEVLERTGLSEKKLYARIRAREFPSPVRVCAAILPRKVKLDGEPIIVWVESEVCRWIYKRAADAEAAAWQKQQYAEQAEFAKWKEKRDAEEVGRVDAKRK